MAPLTLWWLLRLAALCHLTVLLAGQQLSVKKCSTLCTKMTAKIPASRLIRYRRNQESCRKPTIILETRQRRLFCADPEERWVQEAMEYLDRTTAALIQNGGTFEKQIGVSEPGTTPATRGMDRSVVTEPEATEKSSSQEAQRALGTSPELPTGVAGSWGTTSLSTSKAPDGGPPAGPERTELFNTAAVTTATSWQSSAAYQPGSGLWTEGKASDAPSTQTLPTQAPSTQTLPTQAPSTQTLPTQAPSTQTLPTQAPSTQTLPPQAPSTQTLPPQAPSPKTLSTWPSSTQTLSARAPSTQTLSARAPSTQTLSTWPSSTQTLSARAPSTQTLSARAPFTQTLSAWAPFTQTPIISHTAQEDSVGPEGQSVWIKGQNPMPENSLGPKEMGPLSAHTDTFMGPRSMPHVSVVPAFSDGAPSREPVASGSWAPKAEESIHATVDPQRLGVNIPVPNSQAATRRQAVGLLAFLGLLFCLGVAMFAYQSLQGCPRKVVGDVVERLHYVPRSCGSNSYVLVPV